MKKAMIVFALFVLSAFLMFGCTSPEPNINSDNINPVVDANNQFSIDLYSEYKLEEGNIFFSPYSISTALAMTYEGAEGQTKEEMASVLHYPANKTILKEVNLGLYQSINTGNNEYTLKTANALWGQKDYNFKDSYIQDIETYYKGHLTNLDFINNPTPSADEINTWCDKETNGKIDKIISPELISIDTKLILTNAIYFKGEWKNGFDSDLTVKRDFYASENKTVEVDMMFMGEEKFSYTEDENVQVLEMSYKGEDISMIIILPKENNLTKIENSLTLEKINDWKSKLSNEEIYELYIPKLKFDKEYKMKDKLSEMGMGTAFSDYADFSGMNAEGKTGLKISQIIHKSYIEMDEKGTEAAAATAVVTEDFAAMDPDPNAIIFNANHPFIFIIQDKETGTILFMGRFSNPTV